MHWTFPTLNRIHRPDITPCDTNRRSDPQKLKSNIDENKIGPHENL